MPPHQHESEGRRLRVGDEAETDYPGWYTRVKIRARREGVSQSGILFQTDPPLREWHDLSNPYDEGPDSWYDADWFRLPRGQAQGVLF